MDISSANAHSIVTEISSILGQNVNLIDSTGEIIASTDLTWATIPGFDVDHGIG